MHLRKLGFTDLELTTIGFGSWAIGGGNWRFGWGDQDDDVSIKAIHTALDQGINWIDTAAIYGCGHSEEVIGIALKQYRGKRPFIATKFGRRWDENREPIADLSPASIREEVDDSLRRLQIDVIDLYQMHWPQPDEQIEDAWQTVADLVKEGKLRYGGVSNFSIEQMRRVQPILPIASLQPPYSMLRRDIETDILDFCGENKIGVIVYSPLQKGLLTGKVTHERVQQMPANDHRINDPNFNEPALSKHLATVEQLKPIAQRNNISLSQLAIAWTLRRPEVTSAIVGTRKPEQITETATAGNVVLVDADLDEIEKILSDRD